MAVSVAFGHCAAKCTENGCPKDEEARHILGCDGDGLGVWVDCWACHGKRADCPECEETGMGTRGVRVPRCPNLAITANVREVMQGFQMMRMGFLPASGGWLDQSATFVSAVSILEGLRALHEERELGNK